MKELTIIDELKNLLPPFTGAELTEMQKTCPNRLVPLIRNYTIQCIPEHQPDELIGCLFSLFKLNYRKKLFLALGRKMFHQDGEEIVWELIYMLQNNFNKQ
jgi:hypothetical protein